MNLSPAQHTATSAAVVLLSLVATGCGTAPTGSPITRPDNAWTRSDVSLTQAPADHRPAPPPAQAGNGTHSPFDLDDPTVARLDPDLLAAVQAAARDASADGVRLWITSGWRSRAKQQSLLDAAVSRYGSLEEALRHVSTPDTSAHVTGDAVDIGPTEADDWLSRYGAQYGLCQSFANEIWHFELVTDPGTSCPEPIPDSSYR